MDDSKDTKKPFISAQQVRNAIPVIDAVLASVSTVPPVAPYANAARVLTQAGAGALFDPQTALLKRMKLLQAEINDTAAAEVSKMERLQLKMSMYLEMLLDTID